MKKFKVFNVEVDGIDKSGKDSVLKQIFAVDPNKYIPKTRGLMSQIAYSKLFNRNYEYEVPFGYLECTLFVLLTVDENDWNIRCKLTNEHENNKKRSDVENEIHYKTSSEAFEYAYNKLRNTGIDESHIMKFNTSVMTPYQIITAIVERLNSLNEFSESK